MKKYYLGLLAILLIPLMVGLLGYAAGTLRSSRRTDHREDKNLIQRLDQINGRNGRLGNIFDTYAALEKRASAASSSAEQLDQIKEQQNREIDALARDVWNILDDSLTTLLNQSASHSLTELNSELEQTLQTTTTPERFGWSAEIRLSATPITDLYLATYQNFYTANDVVSTLRVMKKGIDGWQVVGKMEEEPLITDVEPKHRSELKQFVKAQERALSFHRDASSYLALQSARATVHYPIAQDNIVISSGSIKLLNRGGLDFVSLHFPRSTQGSEPTAIEWQWSATGGLDATAWVWGDQWMYDSTSDRTTAKWQSVDRNKNGTKVVLEDLNAN